MTLEEFEQAYSIGFTFEFEADGTITHIYYNDEQVF